MKVIDITIRFRVEDDVQESDVSSWVDDIFDLVVDYSSFKDATGYEIKELPGVIESNAFLEI